MNRRWRRSGLFALGLGAGAALPGAVAASCSSNDTAAPLPLANASALTTLKVASTSTHSAVVWPALIRDASISSYAFYLAEAAQTNEALSALPASSWQNTLPAQVNYDHAKRFLYAKVTPASGFGIEQALVDLTASTNLQAIKSRIDSSDLFATLDLSRIVIQVFTDRTKRPALGEITVPDGTQIRYDLGPNQVGLTGEALLSQLSAPANPTELKTVSAYLVVTDETRYVLNDARRTDVEIVIDPTSVASISAEDLARLGTIAIAPGATNEHLLWNALPALSNQIDSLSFLSGNYPGLGEAERAPLEAWSDALPTSAPFETTERFLWVRVRASRNVVLSNKYYDITTTSSVRNALGVIDTTKGVYAAFDLSQLALETDQGGSFKLAPEQLLLQTPPLVRVRFKFDNTTGDSVQLLSYLNTNVATITDAQLASIKIYLVSNNTNKYLLSSSREISLTNHVQIVTSSGDLSVDLAAFAKVTFSAESNSSRITWSAINTKYTYDFNSGSSPTLESLKSYTNLIWSPELPTYVDRIHERRFVWARLKQSANVLVREAYLNLTDVLKVQSIKTIIDGSANYAGYESRKIFLEGSGLAPYINELGVPRIVGSHLSYVFKGATYASRVALAASILAARTTVTIDDLKAIVPKLVVYDPARYVISVVKTPAFVVNLDAANGATFDLAGGATAVNLENFLRNQVEIATDSTYKNLKWNPVEAHEAIASLKFLSGNYRSTAEAEANATLASESLPTSTDIDYAKRYLYAIVTLKPNYTSASGKLVIDLTDSSRLRNQEVRVFLSELLQVFNLSAVKLSGKIGQALTLDLAPAGTLPTGIKLAFIEPVTQTYFEPSSDYKTVDKIAASRQLLESVIVYIFFYNVESNHYVNDVTSGPFSKIKPDISGVVD